MADNSKSSRIREDKREEEEEEEDVKMEKFFALIRNFREARDYYKRKEMSDLEKNNRSHKKAKRVGGEQSSCNWVPKFEQEDFAREVVEFRRTPLLFFPRPHNEEKNKKEGEDDGGLDLRLTL
ncbi:hypothetical protein I3760_07G120600 [Carya illinoinensis]|uniref:Protein NIM1-INTERACTING 1-like n=1 Tax=Carya illinoinensis TaxID=32201 RepID=A0A8T1Q289_CARIL|nr:protein NIM1-INTERACTING 1-like [Carya illinoinensis]KAG2697765.1 hypothetical protein I3760_07G120600 [Carya illinoinensis]KAG6648063.1 hypothetical protein CIPAW_07G122000 [Carya illinoinensis]KAG6704219.1 hypothetical protein I3842_07G125000 [Carya illinoinensis]